MGNAIVGASPTPPASKPSAKAAPVMPQPRIDSDSAPPPMTAKPITLIKALDSIQPPVSGGHQGTTRKGLDGGRFGMEDDAQRVLSYEDSSSPRMPGYDAVNGVSGTKGDAEDVPEEEKDEEEDEEDKKKKPETIYLKPKIIEKAKASTLDQEGRIIVKPSDLV